MNIIIPVLNNNSSKFTIAKGFHNAEYSCIYNSDENTYKWIVTKEITKDSGNLSLGLKRNDIYTVISSNHIPRIVLGLFTDSGLTVYKAQSRSVLENIKLFIDNQLEPFSIQSTLNSISSCSSSCGSCSSTTCN